MAGKYNYFFLGMVYPTWTKCFFFGKNRGMKEGHQFGRPGLRGAAGWVCAVLLAVLLARLGAGLREMRGGGEAAHGRGVPPALNVVMMGLGGFRGILAEVLWFRMSRLQMEGRYLELTQLSDWITRLDPHATQAWTYNAWNLAYNVSAMMRRPEDRLRWVANGILLLRNDALDWIRDDPQLYRELAWLYRNKIGSSLDRAHVLYKLSLAETMAPLVDETDGTIPENLSPETRTELLAMRLDPQTMRALQTRFGPLDWRMAESHALYWSMLGLAHADADSLLACRRDVYQTLLTASMEQGRFTGDLEAGVWSAASNEKLLDGAENFLRETHGLFPREGVASMYARFLAHRIRLAGTPRDEIEARYGQLRALAPEGAQTIPLELLLELPAMPPEFFRRAPTPQ